MSLGTTADVLTAPAPVSVRVAVLTGDPSAPSEARRRVAWILPDCPRLDDALVIVSELVTNSLLHSASAGGGRIILAVRRTGNSARILVVDQGDPGAPRDARTDDTDEPLESGRGLAIVGALADMCDIARTPGRTESWAEVAW